MRPKTLGILFLLLATACKRDSSQVKQYQLLGRVVSLDAKDHVVTIDTQRIPNWMDAMTMEYPVKHASEFDTLKVGESITATLNVRGPGDYDLSEIQAQSSLPKQSSPPKK